MDNETFARRAAALTTPHLADGCIRAGIPVRTLSVHPVIPGTRLAGRALPAQHAGSVDIFLEAFGSAEPGDVLVADNLARTDESCIGDLVTLEAKGAGLTGILIWGLHRDTVDIRAIGLPVFSLGAIPTGPIHTIERPADALTVARVAGWEVTRDDFVVADEDGAIIIPAESVDEVLAIAEGIRDTERAQADRIVAGESLRDQLQFAQYLERKAADPSYGLRQHLRELGGAIEV